MLLILFTGIKPTYRLVRGWLRHDGLVLFDTLMVAGWVGVALILSALIALFLSIRGVRALQPG